MPFSSTDLLQFPELCDLIARFAGSVAGKERISSLEPHSDPERLQVELAETAEALSYSREIPGRESDSGAAIRLRFDSLPDIESSLPAIKVEGARLDGLQILDLFKMFEIAGEYRSALLNCSVQFPLLGGYGDRLANLVFLADRWRNAFLPGGRLADTASVALNRIRRDIEKQKQQIQESLNHFLRAHRSDGTLQEDFVTIREDRYVVPVVAGQRGKVDGVIHGASGSGRTLFVEPLETISFNNQLVRLRDDEEREVDRILHEITGSLREHQQEILVMAETLTQLDFLFAKAGFGLRYDAVIPTVSAEHRRLSLQKARHPLLQSVLAKAKKPIVPLSFELDNVRRCLLISGPNTGGKTVTMKTAGLLALMAHAALPVPCESAAFPLLNDVLADVGDNQSIEESLSSFSGHLLHVKKMLETVTSDSLVLLDELGRATDPEEGGALGVAILEEFRKSGCFCLASTHLLPLKLYGTRTPNVVNASMGFDGATLAPTYELRLGLPGKSAGLDIATRLQLPANILQHARSVLPRLQADLQDLLSDLHRQTQENARASEALASEREQLSKRTAALEQDSARREAKRKREWERKSEELIADFEARALLTMKDLREKTENERGLEQARRTLSQTRREFQEEAAQVITPESDLTRAAVASPVFKEGARVKLRDVRETATIRRFLKNGLLEVEAGLLRMQVSPADVLQVVSDTSQESKKLPVNVRVQTGPRFDVSYRELNIIGQRADDALESVDRFLDSAVLSSVDRVRIVHGHGMGVLKKVVAEHLRGNPHVGRYYAAAPAEGGTGATIVELRE